MNAVLLRQAIQLERHGKFAEAEILFRQMLKQKRDPVVLNAYAVLLARQGHYAKAETVLKKLLRKQPHWADASMNLGNLYLERGNVNLAAQLFQQLIDDGHIHAGLYYNFGRALIALGQIDKALKSLQSAIDCDPRFLWAYNELGNLLRKMGDADGALACYRQALTYLPAHSGLWLNMSNAQLEVQDFAAAAIALQQALTLQPNYAEAWSTLSALQLSQGQLEAAVQSGRRAVAIAGAPAAAYRNLAQVLIKIGDTAGAYASLIQECAHPAASLDSQLYLIRFLGAIGRYDEAWNREQALGTALASLASSGLYLFAYHREICQWRDYENFHRQVLDYLIAAHIERGVQIPPWTALDVEGLQGSQLKTYTQAVARYQFAALPALPSIECALTAPEPRLKLGYISGDFHAHATAYLLAELFELHDRQRYAVYAYAIDVDDGSPMRQRLRAAFEYWRDVSQCSYQATAAQIRADGIQILIDLKGYTQHARPEILALRPAPIQVHYLGYPGTLGMAQVDYLIADPFLIPPEYRSDYQESIAYLPDCYQANDRQRVIGAPTTRAAEGLPESGLVLGCFNHPRKLTPTVFTIWCRLLQQIDTAVLWLFAPHPLTQQHLCMEAEARGIAANRLYFAAHQPLKEHLARLRLADLLLDTVPVNAHTTASDALWAGVPLITCAGATFAARVAGSLLTTLGLNTLVTYNLADYEARILQLLTEPGLLVAVREQLATARDTTALFDCAAITRNLEALYTNMWQRHQAGQPPDTLLPPIYPNTAPAKS